MAGTSARDGERRDLGLSAAGMILAALAFGAALTPSLLPRDPVMQGVLGGVVAALGYGAGAAGYWLWRFLGLPATPLRRRRALRLAAFVLGLAIVIGFLRFAADWQNVTREVMGLPLVETAYPLTVGGVAAAVSLALLALGRLFGMVLRLASAALGRLMPPRLGMVVGFALAVWLFWSAIDGVLLRRAFEVADASFEAADLLIEPHVPRPEDPAKTGSAESLVAWNQMGRRGREFVALSPTAEEIAEFAGPAAREAVRVYVGRRSADTPEERAEIALAELIRAGGFERSVLVVVAPTGTGWMDPGAHDTLDFILGGDVATVAVQYSYLTSPLALAVHPEYGVDQAKALFDTIYDHWTTLPKDARPKLYVHGLSQGAYNSETTLPLLDMLGDPISGAMWAGSPFISPLWEHVKANRRLDSPAWRPRFGNGSLVRVTNQENVLDEADAPWGPIRLVFLSYGSDPIVVASLSTAFRRPDWMTGERAPDVPDNLRWFPVVTAFQLALDMMIALQVPGYGHYYIAPHYIDAWAAVLDPPGWSPERAAELHRIFEARGSDF